MKRASRLDKVRWLLVYTTDFMLLVSLIGLVQLVVVWQEYALPVPLLVALAVLNVVFFGLSTRPLRVFAKGGPRPTRLLVISGVLALALLVFGIIWVVPVWLAMMAPFVHRRTLLVMAVGLIVLVTGVAAVLDVDIALALLLVLVVTIPMITGGVLANLWLWRIAREAHEGQEAKAKLAVSEERLRFARDLNDLVGRSLAEITSKSEQAETAEHMFEVRDLARSSLREVRSAVQGYRALDLDEVLASVRAVLEAADVHCVVDADLAGLPFETRTLLASVVREGATNILKHSTASRCTITIKDGVLEMSNDGVESAASHSASGLKGLAQRMSAAGGDLSAAPADNGTFLLRAAVRA